MARLKICLLIIFKRTEVNTVMIALFAVQVAKGWIKLEDIPEIWRDKVEEILNA